MKKLLLSLFALLLVVTACSSSSSDAKSSGDKDKKTVYMITDTGGIDDKSFNQGTWEGIQLLAKTEDINTEYISSSAEADYNPNLSAAADNKPELIVAAGFKFATAMKDVATANPNQNFLIIDSVVEEEDGTLVSNVANAVFAEHEGSYLAGVAAGMEADAKGKTKVGFIGGEEFPLIEKFGAGFKQGVQSVNPKIEVDVAYVGSFEDSGLGKIVAQKMYDDGAYIIHHAAGGSGNGVIQAAQERFEKDSENPVWVVGVDRDQYEDGIVKGTDHSVILTSMIKRVDVASHDVSKLALEGKFPGGEILVFDLENDGVGIPEKNPNLSEDIITAVAAAKDEILAGNIVVSETFE